MANEYAAISRVVGVGVLLQNQMFPPQSDLRDLAGIKAPSLKADFHETPQSHLWSHRMGTEGLFPEREFK